MLLTHLCRDLLLGLSLSQTKSNLVPAGGNLPASSPVVASHPFVGVRNQGGQPPATVQFLRLTRFVEMSLDSWHAHLNQMISQGRFEHIGRASIRLEGATHGVSGSVLISGLPHWGTDQG